MIRLPPQSTLFPYISFLFFFLMIRRPPNSPLFPSPPLFRSRDDAIQRALAAPIHHAEPAAADLLGILEAGSHQLRRDPGVHIPLRRQRVALCHRSSRYRSEEHTSELQSLRHLVCRLLLEKKK